MVQLSLFSNMDNYPNYVGVSSNNNDITIHEEAKPMQSKKNKPKKTSKMKYRNQIIILKGLEPKLNSNQLFPNLKVSNEVRTYKLKPLSEVDWSLPLNLTDKQFKRLSQMLNGIATKRQAWLNVGREELVSELWIKSIEVIRRSGELNMSVIGRSCWNRLNDIFREKKRKSEKFVYASEWIEKVDIELDNSLICVEDDRESNLIIDEMLNLFEEDSEERKFIELELYYIGLRDVKGEKPADLKKESKKQIEINIAQALGYVNDMANGYRVLKNKVRSVLIEQGYKIPLKPSSV